MVSAALSEKLRVTVPSLFLFDEYIIQPSELVSLVPLWILTPEKDNPSADIFIASGVVPTLGKTPGFEKTP